MYTGWNSTGRVGWRRKPRTVMATMPPLGGSSRPVRERPPSTKYSMEWPPETSWATYSLSTAEYSALPRMLRRMKNAPPLRRIVPTTGRLRLMPATMCGGTMPRVYSR